MKLIKNIYLMAGALALCSVGFVACDDDDHYDFPGDPYNKVYVADHSASTKIVQTPVGTVADFNVSFPAVCKSPAEGDIAVTLAIDNDLIDAYNEEHETNYKAMPENALVVSNKNLTIPKGETSSNEEFAIALTDDADILATLDNLDGYLIPVRMTAVSGGNAKAAVSVPSISYFELGVGFDVTDPDATKENRTGQLVADRSGWSVSLVGQGEVDGDPMSWFDDDSNSQCSFTDPDFVTVVVDLGKEYKFDGITSSYLYYGWWTYGTFSSGCKVALSSDNKSWMEVFESEGTNDFIGFYGAMPARYIRISAPNPYAGQSWAYYYSADISSGDFNIYATN